MTHAATAACLEKLGLIATLRLRARYVAFLRHHQVLETITVLGTARWEGAAGGAAMSTEEWLNSLW